MWTREELKARAKSVLKVSYWKALIVSLIIAFVTSGGGNSNGRDSSVRNNINGNFNGEGFNSAIHFGNEGFKFNMNFADFMLPGWVAVALGFALIGVLIFVAFKILIGSLLEVGGRRYFIHQAQNDADMNNIGYGFNSNRYKDIVITMLWRGLLNFLWFLLLIIPGIVKSYAYKMVPYILADNPNIGYKRAVELSVQMTEGEKFNMFVLDLSFIGWYLLGGFVFGIGGYFVNPYKYATEAELYLVLKQHAINVGICSYDELLEKMY